MKRKLFRDKVGAFCNFERAAKQELEDIAAKERKSFSLVLDEAVLEFIDRKKLMGLVNPISVHYDDVNKQFSLFDFMPMSRNIQQPEARMLVDRFVSAGFDIHKVRGNCNQLMQEIDRRKR